MGYGGGTSAAASSIVNADTLDLMDSNDFLQVANDLSDVDTAAEGRTSLGLSSVVDNSSGADLIGVTAITETGANATVQSVIEALITRLKAVTNDSSGADLLGMTAITETGANATVQSIIEALITRIKAVTDSASGGDLVGMTAIADLGAAATAQAQIEALVTLLKAVTDSASGGDLVGMTAITETGANATVQSIIEALITAIKSTTNDSSGGDLVGLTAISGWTGGDVQTVLEAAKADVDLKLVASATIPGVNRYVPFTLTDPNAQYAIDPDVMVFYAPAALTITNIKVTLDAVTNELNFNLNKATSFITKGSEGLVATCDTTSGVFDSGAVTLAVASGQYLYISLDATPHADITQVFMQITFDFD